MAVNVSGGGAPTGAAGGQLAGTYPNPDVANTHGVSGVQTHHADAHGASSHTDRTTTRYPITWSNTAAIDAAESETSWFLYGTDLAESVLLTFTNAASDDARCIFGLCRMPSDMVAGTPNLDVLMASQATAGNYVLRFRSLELADGVTLLDAAGSVTTTGALTVSATDKAVEFEAIAFAISTLAAGDWVSISVARAPLDANDTLAAGVSILQAAALVYTADQ